MNTTEDNRMMLFLGFIR